MRIPDGFAVTAAAYREALDAAGAWGPLHALLDRLDKRDLDALAHAGAQAREIVYAAPMPAPWKPASASPGVRCRPGSARR